MNRLRWLVESVCVVAMIALTALLSPLLMAYYLWRMNRENPRR